MNSIDILYVNHLDTAKLKVRENKDLKSKCLCSFGGDDYY